jgi:hypothetical protein
MQTPVRYYITQDDDRAVVRSIPVTLRASAEDEPQPVPVAPAGPLDSPVTPSDRRRVERLVRAARRQDKSR